MKYEAFDLNLNGEELGYVVFAEKGLIASQELSTDGWYDVTSSFIILDGVMGYAIADYSDSEGYINTRFCKLREVPSYEIKRGRIPKNQIVINGKRYWKP